MEFRNSISQNLVLILCLGLASCWEQKVWKSDGLGPPQKRQLWIAPILGDGLAPGSQEVLREICKTQLRLKGWQINTDSIPMNRDFQLHIQALEFRYKRGLGEDPVLGLHIEFSDSSKRILSSMELTGDGNTWKPWAGQSLSALASETCQRISQDLLP